MKIALRFFSFLALSALALSALGVSSVRAAGLPPDNTADGVYGQSSSFNSNGNASPVSANSPRAVALDSGNNLYVSDSNNNRVLFFPAGSTTATRVYGQGGSFSANAANNNGISADSLFSPGGIALDGSDNLYVADVYNHRVLYYPAGSTTATRVYGQGGSFTAATANNGGINANSLSSPRGVAVDGSGNLYVADASNNRVLYYPAGSTTATRVYGQGGVFTTNTGNKGGISATSLFQPYGVDLSTSGALYVADYSNNRVLYYAAGVTTATRVYGQGGSFTANTSNNGGISASSLFSPSGLALDDSNNLYVADMYNSRVLYYAGTSTTATRVYGQGGSFTTNTSNKGGLSADSLYYPYGAIVDGSGNLFVVDTINSRVLRYLAGSTTAMRVYGQGGSFTSAMLNIPSADSLAAPRGATLDGSGNFYVADSNNNRVLYYPAGSATATAVYGQGGSFTANTANAGGISADSLSSPRGLALDGSNNLYVVDANNHRVLYYPAGSTTATLVYGQGGSFAANTANNGGVSADSLYSPAEVAVDSGGNVYVADWVNNRVLYYPAGSTTATRVYGQGGDFTTNTANNGGISADSLYSPAGVALDSGDNLYVADYSNNRVLYYPAGSTTATRVYGQDGNFTTNTANSGGVNASSLLAPSGVALDGNNNLFVVDTNNNRVLYYPADSAVATSVFGQGGNLGSNGANNGGISASSLYQPRGLAWDASSGSLYVADTANSRGLRYGPPAPTVTTDAATVITSTGATLNGTVNANNVSTTVTFEYGLTSAYGANTPATPDTVSGTADTPVTANLNGLAPNTTYHFRVKGVSANGASNGLDRTFTTLLPGEPTVQASAVHFTALKTTSLTVNWTPGNGAARLVVMKSGSAVDANPVDGTHYPANPVFGSGAQIGAGNFVIYNGSGSSVSVSGLSGGTTYHVAVYEFNGASGAENYLLPGATGSTTTKSIPIIAQGASVSVTMSEDGAPIAWSAPTITASDPDGDPLTWSKASGPSHGVANVSGTGSTPTITYTPALNYHGADSFVVKVADVDGSATIIVNVTILPVADTPLITWETPANIVYGTALGATQLNATASIPGAFVYTPAADTILAAGTHTLHVDFTPDDTTNYTNASKDVDIVVTPAPLTITAASETMVYGGAVPSITPGYSGLVAGDTAPATLPACATTATAFSAVGAYASTCADAADANYDPIAYVPGVVTITPAPLAITASSESMSYGGTVPTITPSYSGLVADDTAPATAPACATAATALAEVGSYASTCAGAVDANYDPITYIPGVVNITPVPLVITASDESMAYGGAVPTITPLYTGLAADDTASATPPTCTTTATSASPVGAYPSTCFDAADPNYDPITYADGVVTIAPAAALITFGPAPTPTYPGADFTVSATTTNTDDPTLTFSVASGPCVRLSAATFTPTGAGTCTVRADGAATLNFAAAMQTQPVLITQVAPRATTEAATLIATTVATLHGTVNANGAESAVTFEYGPTDTYGSSVPADQSPVTGQTDTPVSQAIPGLLPNTTYHFRVVATNSGGTTFGADLTFKTAAMVARTQNGGFELYAGTKIPKFWTASKFGAPDGKDTLIKKFGKASIKLNRTSAASKILTQTLALSGSAGDAFALSYWVRGNNLSSTGLCQVQVLLYNNGKLSGSQTLKCPARVTYAWTKITGPFFKARAAYNKVVIRIVFSKTSGTAWFDGLILMR